MPGRPAGPSRRSKTDPEPDMDGGRASVRNVRSKCRCSHVLQFTFRRAVCCVLHRPPSQVIHCTVLCHSHSLSFCLSRCRALWLVAATATAHCTNTGSVLAAGARVFSRRRRRRRPLQGRRPVGARRGPGRSRAPWTKAADAWADPGRRIRSGPGDIGRPAGTATTSVGGGGGPSPRGGSPLRQTGRSWRRSRPSPSCCQKGRRRPRNLGVSARRSSRFRRGYPAAGPQFPANDPTAGSPTVTLLRLLLPLNAQVWKSSRAGGGGRPRERPASRGPVQMPH